jgi:hypothetical protein
LRAHGLVEPLLDEAAEVRQRPARRLSSLGIRPDKDPMHQHRLLALAEDLPPVAVRTIHQSGQPLGIEPDHRVAQGLALHPGRPRRLGAAHALQRVGHGEEALHRASAWLAPGQATQLGGAREVGADRLTRSYHRSLLLHRQQASTDARLNQLTFESTPKRGGMRRPVREALEAGVIAECVPKRTLRPLG